MTEKKKMTGALSNNHKIFIQENKDKGAEWIFNQIHKSKVLIEKYIVEISPDVSQPIKGGDLFGRNKKYGAVVMTPAASESGDTVKKTGLPERYSKHIHQIKKD